VAEKLVNGSFRRHQLVELYSIPHVSRHENKRDINARCFAIFSGSLGVSEAEPEPEERVAAEMARPAAGPDATNAVRPTGKRKKKRLNGIPEDVVAAPKSSDPKNAVSWRNTTKEQNTYLQWRHQRRRPARP
jgi:hypothetical protein